MQALRPWLARHLWLLILFAGIAGIALALAAYGRDHAARTRAPTGEAIANGRIEAVEVDIAARAPFRVKEIVVEEGDVVSAGQVVATMDTSTLEGQRGQAEAQLRRATLSAATVASLVTGREAERAQARALLAQREAQLGAATRRLERTEQLARSSALSQQVLDDDRAAEQVARAGRAAATAQVAAADVAVTAAKMQALEAEAAVEAARAALDTIGADIRDASLRAPRAGRVQLKVAEPGEVLPAGGRVLRIVDLDDVYMSFFLPAEDAGRIAVGGEVRIELDADPGHPLDARVSFVSDVAQFTPKTVETAKERQKLVFRVKARIAPDVLRGRGGQVKIGMPATAHVRLAATPSPSALAGSFVR